MIARARNRSAAGFTLIEILVALAIVAIALAAGMRALAQSADSASALKARTLALWVAQNRLALAQLAAVNAAPDLGEAEGYEEQAGARFLWRTTVTGTPNPVFRRVDVVVADPAQAGYALAALSGYVANVRKP